MRSTATSHSLRRHHVCSDSRSNAGNGSGGGSGGSSDRRQAAAYPRTLCALAASVIVAAEKKGSATSRRVFPNAVAQSAMPQCLGLVPSAHAAAPR